MRVIDQNGNIKQSPGAPVDANYLLWVSNNGTLTNDRVLTIGDGLGMSYTIPGTTFVISGRGWNKIGTQTVASSSATVEFTGLTGGTSYTAYSVHFRDVVPATDNVSLSLRTSTNNGSSFDSAANTYDYSRQTAAGTSTTDVLGTAILMTSTSGNNTNESISGLVYFHNPNVSNWAHFTWVLLNSNTANTLQPIWGGGRRRDTTAVNAIQFFMSSGNIASGTFDLYGLAY